MLKRLILAALMWACISTVAEARERYFNYCQKGGQKVVTQGLQSSAYFQRTLQSCTIRVYISGTTTLATIYSDNLFPDSTPLANPFTAASDGFFFFYASAGKYDVQETFTDTTVTPSVVIQLTWGAILLCDPLGPNEDAVCVGAGGEPIPHNLLSPTHPDTEPYTPPEMGDLTRGALYQLWQRFGTSQIGEVLTLIDAGGVPMPDWAQASSLNTCTEIQDDGVTVGCEHAINIIGTDWTFEDDSDNSRINITPTGGGGAATTSCPNEPTSGVFKKSYVYPDAYGAGFTSSGDTTTPNDSYFTLDFFPPDVNSPFTYVSYGGDTATDSYTQFAGNYNFSYPRADKINYGCTAVRLDLVTNSQQYIGFTTVDSTHFADGTTDTIKLYVQNGAFVVNDTTDPTHFLCQVQAGNAGNNFDPVSAVCGTADDQYHVWEILFNGTTNVKFYMDGTLVATVIPARPYDADLPMNEWVSTSSDGTNQTNAFDMKYWVFAQEE